MKIKQINTNTILASINISKSEELLTQCEYNKFFYKALLIAKKQFNFDTTNSKLLINTFVTNSSRISFSISKIQSNTPLGSLVNIDSDINFFKFDNYDDLQEFCNCIPDTLLKKYFSLYNFNNTYYLVPLIKFNLIPNYIAIQLLDFSVPLVDVYLHTNLIKHATLVSF